MFQVQQHRTSLHHTQSHSHAHSHSHTYSQSQLHPHSYSQYELMHASPSLGPTRLPRALARPARLDISRDNIIAIEPNLDGASPEYVRAKLRERGDEFARMAASVHIPPTLQRAQLSSAQYMTVRAPHASAASLHILAVFSIKTPPQDPSPLPSDTGYLFATHMLNLAINCARLPRLPRASGRLRADGTADLPVIHINVPHAEAFAPLHAYLLTHRVDRFFGMMFPVLPSLASSARGSSASAGAGPLAHLNPQHLAATLVQSATGDKYAAVMSSARFITAVWQNTCSLGIFDPHLWSALDLAWEVVLAALNMTIGGK